MSKPERKFQAGCIDASVFENEIQHDGKFIKIKKVAFQKRYKSANGWQTTYTLDLNDVPKAILVLSKAYEFMAMNSETSIQSEMTSQEKES